jgi:hypothetical protein
VERLCRVLIPSIRKLQKLSRASASDLPNTIGNCASSFLFYRKALSNVSFRPVRASGALATTNSIERRRALLTGQKKNGTNHPAMPIASSSRRSAASRSASPPPARTLLDVTQSFSLSLSLSHSMEELLLLVTCATKILGPNNPCGLEP